MGVDGYMCHTTEQEKTENTLEDKVEADIFIEEQYPIEEKIPESELADDFT